ncbi:menaquinone biosynthetic enzyme MqnA/MqnD family protein [Paenibacillus sp. J2TS4]|uniref:menaquinone biosynthetic enzyme MqnA/MqnD family protein n=1 Tax=Paenibacillus sp. J2TS4 TaxID=2807194 RepID=UPI001B11075F|nr:menaquinone biosynthesis protein [Paenibacillus sp. J2TS4]GIP32391.1 chorismate dehydratase [Paenibacillus sp. J2TS4]
MDNNREKVRIGRINYTNVWPIFYYFPMDRFQEEVELLLQVPTSLNKALAEGKIDMGPISSFAYGQYYKDCVLFPDLSVSAFGKVRSILLFHRKPLEQIVNGTIALPTTSASSVNLLKIIIAKFYGGQPTYSYASPSLNDMMKETDAALLIGDDAIRADWNNPGYHVTDLGQLWKHWTGRSMTFAVWAVREQAMRNKPDVVRRIYEAFCWSKEQGLANSADMVRDAQSAIGGTEQYWQQYFERLTYDFGPAQWDGLRLYYQYGWELGLLEEPVSLKIWHDNSVIQVNE